MLDKKEKLKPSEYASRAVAGMSQGLRGHAVTTTGGMGLLLLTPKLRDKAFYSKNVPKSLQTKTPEQIANLAEKMIRAGGRNPHKGRKVILNPMGQKGYADVIQEWRKKGGKPRDILRLGMDVAPESMAHEVGHMTGNSAWAKALRRVSGITRSTPALALPSLLALSGALSKDDKELPMHAKAAPILGGAQLATILGEETRANLRGAKILKRLGHNMSLAKKLKMFLPTATYLGHAGLLVGTPLGILKGMELYNESKKKKQPLDPGTLIGRSPEELAKVPLPEEAKKKWEKRFKGV